MSLATRCPACNTVFRVVQDQLRVSEGWVRCGRCSEVFNAVEQMVGGAAPATSSATGSATGFAGVAAGQASSGTSAESSAQSSFNAPINVSIEQHQKLEAPETAHAELPGQLAVAGVGGVAADTAGHTPPPSAAPESASGTPLNAEPSVDEPPSFLRAAERAERWQRPGVRRAVAASSSLLALLLIAQIFIEYRDLIAARWPALRPSAEWACSALGCRVELPKMVDALMVESSGLLRIEGTTTYRLSVVLRNRAPMELAMPSIELNLSDSQGRSIARRAIHPSELGVGQSRLLASSELSMQGTLAVPDKPVAGYTIDIFYP